MILRTDFCYNWMAQTTNIPKLLPKCKFLSLLMMSFHC